MMGQSLMNDFAIIGVGLETDESPVEALRGDRRRAAAHEGVEHHARNGTTGLDHPLDDFQRLLGRVVF
ncbi:MAG TPA: hypothetical protein VN829_16600, partial [Dongiaceae bacterium]|nr:hypothetical protein [Dongiaceae bacterium]